MNKIIRIAALFLVISLAISLFAACSGDRLSDIKKNGEIVVYTDPNFYPFEFMGSDGPEGVDIEIARAIADNLGVTLKIQESEFDAIIMALKGGKGDIAISGMTITDERKKSVDFSNPYINSVQYMIIRNGSVYKVLEDLAGQKIGVAFGYTGAFIIEDEIDDGVLTDTGASMTEYPSANEATLDLINGKVEAVIMDEHVAKNIVAVNGGLTAFELAYADGAIAEEEYGVVVPKGNKELLARINTVVANLLAEKKIEQWVVQYSN